MQPLIKIKRAYEQPTQQDGYRVLVDRLWPRGLTKEAAALDEWAKALAPSAVLRKWFGHDPELWPDFQKQYLAELSANTALPVFIEQHRNRKVLTLVYGAKDALHNQAIVLQQYLEKQYARQ